VQAVFLPDHMRDAVYNNTALRTDLCAASAADTWIIAFSFPVLPFEKETEPVRPASFVVNLYVLMNDQPSSQSTISSAAFKSSGFSMMLPGTFASPATWAL
jgi:hypothetical protein